MSAALRYTIALIRKRIPSSISFQSEAFMKLRWMCASLLALTQFVQPQSKPEQPALLGYTAQTASSQKDWEKKFQDAIVPDNIRENMRRLSARPHHVGSPYDKDNASGCSPNSRNGDSMRTSKLSTSCFPHRKNASSNKRPHQIPRQAARTNTRDRSHIQSNRRTTPDL